MIDKNIPCPNRLFSLFQLCHLDSWHSFDLTTWTLRKRLSVEWKAFNVCLKLVLHYRSPFNETTLLHSQFMRYLFKVEVVDTDFNILFSPHTFHYIHGHQQSTITWVKLPSCVAKSVNIRSLDTKQTNAIITDMHSLFCSTSPYLLGLDMISYFKYL